MNDHPEVEVRDRFTGQWAAGFQLDDVDPRGTEPRFRLRRVSDGAVLPGWFSSADIRKQWPGVNSERSP